MGKWDKTILVNVCLYKSTKNMNVGGGVPQVKMGLIDCPAIVQPDLSMPLPSEWCAKQGNATPCHLTQLLTNGRQAWEFKEDIRLARWPDRFLINLGHDKTNSVIWLLHSDRHFSKFQNQLYSKLLI